MTPSENETAVVWLTAGTNSNDRVLSAVARELGVDVKLRPLSESSDALRDEPEVVGIELDGDPTRALAQVRRLRDRGSATRIIAATADDSVSAIRQALEAGASEVVSFPLQSAEVAKALLKLTELKRREHVAPRTAGKIVTVYGARGGLGATTLAVNLAVRLRGQGEREVALVDFDLQRGDVAAFLNLTPLQTVATVAAAETEVDAAFVKSTLTRHASGVHVLPAPLQIEEADVVGHEHASIALPLLRGQFSYVVVDTSRTLVGATVAALELADQILVLTDLSVPGVRAARRAIELLRQLGPVRPDLVVVERGSSPVQLKDAERTIGVQAMQVIPRDDSTAAEAMNAGTPLNGKQSGLTLALAELARKLAGEQTATPRRRGLFLRRIFD